MIRYDIETGEKKWKIIVEQSQFKEDRFSYLFGEINGKIYAGLKYGSISEIDISTGEISNTWWEMDSEKLAYKFLRDGKWIELFSSTIGGMPTVLLKKRNKIVGFSGTIYWEINLRNSHLSSYSLNEHFIQKEVFKCSSFVVLDSDEKYLFFTSSEREKNHKLVMFDIENRTIVSSWQLPDEGEYPLRGFKYNGLQIFGKYFIAIEQDNLCHIFRWRG